MDLRDWMLAILPLVGVLIGGLLSGGVELWLRHRQEQRDRRLAARVVLDEMKIAYGLLAAAREMRAVRILPDAARVSTAWTQHRTALGSIDLAAWLRIEASVAALEVFELAYRGRRDAWTGELDSEMPVLERELSAGIDQLAKYVE